MTVRHIPPEELLRREDAVLVVIDVQERLLPHIAEGQKLVKNIIKLIRFFHILELPIILTEQRKLGETVAEIRTELPDVEPITKTDFGCFGCEDFSAALDRIGRSALVLTGIEAHICVMQTALGALPRYGVHAVTDAMSSRSADDWEVAVRRMMQSGVTITSTEMLIYELLQRAGTEEFKAVLELVKEAP